MNLTREPRTANEKTVVALAKLLADVKADPAKYVGDQELAAALKRQSRLAQYSRLQDGVMATSRSTVERLSEKLYDEGFAGIDELRVAALAAIQEETLKGLQAKRRTKKRVEEDLGEAHFERVQSMVDLWHVTNAFHRALKEGRELANLSRDAGLVERWSRVEEMLLAMFDLAERPVVKAGSDAEEWLRRLRRL